MTARPLNTAASEGSPESPSPTSVAPFADVRISAEQDANLGSLPALEAGRSEHTPGPWGVEEFGGSIIVGQLRVGEGRHGFEDILCITDCRDYTDSALARERANARLIASAPELLEAGAEALDTFIQLRADLVEEDVARHAQRIAVIDLEIERLTAAIRKARS